MTTNAKCLLVLDDDEAVARTIGFVAERLGFSVACYDAPEPFFEAVRERNVTKLIAAGGNIYYLAKLAGIFGLGVQDIGAQQTGVSVEAFKARLEAAGR